jgi:hypothetical protein
MIVILLKAATQYTDMYNRHCTVEGQVNELVAFEDVKCEWFKRCLAWEWSVFA